MGSNFFILLAVFTISSCEIIQEKDSSQEAFVETLPDINSSIFVPQSDQLNDELGEDEKIDLAPTVYVDKEPGLYNKALRIHIECEQNGDYPCSEISYTINGSDPNFLDVGERISGVEELIDLEEDGVYSLKVIGRSQTGKISTVRSFNYQLDSRNPVTTILPVAGDYFSPQDLTISCRDCIKIAYTLDGSDPEFDGSNPVENSDFVNLRIGEDQGEFIVNYRSIDEAGNVSEISTARYNIKFRCAGNEISQDGFLPCAYTCSFSTWLEKSSNYNNTQCLCIGSHYWSTEGLNCRIKNDVFYILNL
jgi:Chitobiase/beta-hexosaminidase C-terminal domain